jgi:hypothetical protein
MKLLLRSVLFFAGTGRIRPFLSSQSRPSSVFLELRQKYRLFNLLLFSSSSSSSSSPSPSSSSEIMPPPPPPPASSSAENLDRAKQIIARAISVGAPAYNAGDVRSCANVYKDAAREISDLVPSSLRATLLLEVEKNDDGDHNARAWALRRIFDSIVEYEAPFESSSSSSSRPSDIAPQPASSAAEDLERAKLIIARAISIGAPAYNAGDVRRCANVYRDAAREISDLVPSSLRATLLLEVEKNDDGDHNARAWALRRAFDSIAEYEMPFAPRPATEDHGGIALEPFTTSHIGDGPVGVMDGVMGGASAGRWSPAEEEELANNTFLGRISLANNGGFASLRWRFSDGPRDWSRARGVYVRGLVHSRPGEHTFRLILKDRACEGARLANFKATFANPRGRSADDDGTSSSSSLLLIPFSAFDRMEQMGRLLPGSPALDPRAVTEIGLMAIKPTVVGEFRLDFSEWGLYR